MKGSLRPDIFQQRSEAPYGTFAASVVSPTLGHQVAKLLGTPAVTAKDAHEVTEN